MVESVKKGKKNKQPAPPFITSTLQQEASRKLGFQAKRTMKAAQELYEGVDIEGMGAVGLITYMRTDSLRISEDAVQEAVQFIGERWGKQYLPSKPRHYKARANAQDGHEAIRPTSVALTPKDVESSLTKDQYKLYKLIWERFVACQMANCVLNTTQAIITAGDYIFKASGYNVAFDGYTVLYEEGRDVEEEKGKDLPKLEAGMSLKVRDLKGTQHFTQPPARFTEASLIKTLEENGIGRPSTYAATITTITSREYVTREGKSFKPTELGEVITKLMKERFPDIVNIKFTAAVEKELDEVQSGQEDWVHTLHDFYDDFEKTLKKAKTEMDGVKIRPTSSARTAASRWSSNSAATASLSPAPATRSARPCKKSSTIRVQSARSAAARSSRKNRSAAVCSTAATTTRSAISSLGTRRPTRPARSAVRCS